MRDAVPWMEWDCSINGGTVAAKPPKPAAWFVAMQ
jgi:hypothetical protein